MATVAQMDRYESYLARCGTRQPQSRPRGVALCVEPPLGVRPTLPAARGSPQLAASAVICLLHIISDVTRVRHAQGTTLSILRAFIACAAAVQSAVIVLFGPSCWGTIGRCRGVLPRTNAPCVVPGRPIKQRQNFPQLLIKTYLR